MRRLLILLLFFASSLTAQTYVWDQLPNAPSEGRLEDLSVINPRLIWTAGSLGNAYRSTDGGDNWTLMHSTDYIRSLYFADSLRGWIGKLSGPPSEILEMTTDGGVNWQVVPNLPNPLPDGICGMYGVGDSTIYASGRYNGPPTMLKSDNGGRTWNSLDLSAHAGGLVDCYFFTPDVGLVVGHLEAAGDRDAIVLRTTDGGQSWQQQFRVEIPGNSRGWKIQFLSETVGYVSIEHSDSAAFLKTTDGGINWQMERIVGPTTIQGIGFVNEQIGWVGGWGRFRCYHQRRYRLARCCHA